MKDYLFVYGTLRKNYDLKLKDRVKDELRYVGQAKVGASLYDLGRYPGAIRSKGRNRDGRGGAGAAGAAAGPEVIGDVFLLEDPEKVFRVLDKYEGIPAPGSPGSKTAEFIREKSRVKLRNGKTIAAWIYWYNQDPGD